MSNESKFDPTKPVQFRDGTPARILCLDKMGSVLNEKRIACIKAEFTDGQFDE